LTAARDAAFRRVGWALVALGVADIAVFVWSLQRDVFYPSSFNVFAVAAGLLMIRGSLTAAALVRWTVAFTLACLAALVPIAPALVAPDFMRAVGRAYPVGTALGLAGLAVCVLLFAWMQFELERAAVTDALAAAGKRWRLRGAVVAGVTMTLVLGGLIAVLLRGEFAVQAADRAATQLGAGYRYQVLTLGVFFERRGPYVTASVAGWNEREVRVVPVRWSLAW